MNVRAFLTSIKQAENYTTLEISPYNELSGGGTFTPIKYDENNSEAVQIYADHPRKKGTYSTSAGAYHILEGTYDLYVDAGDVSDFTPMSQDKIALAMIKGTRGAYQSILNNDFEKARQLLLNAQQWTSLSKEGEYFIFEELVKQNIINELNGNSSLIYTPQGKLLNND